jgi:hypothetical protein
MYIFKNFPGEKPPDPRPKGRPRLTRRGGASNAGRDGDGGKEGRGGEGKGRGEGGEGKGWEPPRICMLPTPMQGIKIQHAVYTKQCGCSTMLI